MPLGKLSGSHAFATKMDSLGYQFEKERLDQLFKSFKKLADKKKQVNDVDLMALVIDDIHQENEEHRLEALQLQFVSNGMQGAIVSIQNQT